MRKLIIGFIFLTFYSFSYAQNPGTIGNSQTLCYGSISKALTFAIPPSGGTLPYTYQWQRSNSGLNGPWSNISGATRATFSPPVLGKSAWFRCVVWANAVLIGNTNIVAINVLTSLKAGTIGSAQTICYNTTPVALTGSAASGGGGSYTYQWQNSTNGLSWSNIQGATSTGYAPSALTADKWYRRSVIDGTCGTTGSNTVKITVSSQVNSAQLHSDITIDPNTSTNFSITISGGNSPYTINYTRNGVPQSAVTNYYSNSPVSTGTLPPGTYVYALTSVTSVNGCYAQDIGNPITVVAGPPTSKALVLVNSARTAPVNYYGQWVYYIKPYLDNFGIPYDVDDINIPGTYDFKKYAVIILGHNQVYSSAYPVAALEEAINLGVGLYSFDNHLFDYTSNFNEPESHPEVISDQIKIITDPTHYITQNHINDEFNETNDIVDLMGRYSMIQNDTILQNSYRLVNGEVLATMSSESNTVPLLEVTSYGMGRIVKWYGYNWVFDKVLGPVRGMDDLIWRGIVWAARKPFVMQGLPPIITMRVDDVDGNGEGIRHDFGWISICNEYGIIPWCGTFNNAIPAEYIPTLQQLLQNDLATASPHAFSSNDFIYYNGDNLDPFDPAKNTRDARDFYIANNLKMSKYLVPHYYEIDESALAEIHNMGIEFIGTHMPYDTEYSGAWWLHCGPYRIGRNGRIWWTKPVYYGGNVNWGGYDFFNCITEIRDDGGYEWYPSESDIPGSVERGVRHLRRALNSMVLPTLFTHEDYLEMTPESWRQILGTVTSAVSPYNPEYRSMDYAVQYIRARNNIKITNVSVVNSVVSLTYSGSNDMATKVYRFTESDNQISFTLETLPQISGGSNTLDF